MLDHRQFLPEQCNPGVGQYQLVIAIEQDSARPYIAMASAGIVHLIKCEGNWSQSGYPFRTVKLASPPSECTSCEVVAYENGDTHILVKTNRSHESEFRRESPKDVKGIRRVNRRTPRMHEATGNGTAE